MNKLKYDNKKNFYYVHFMISKIVFLLVFYFFCIVVYTTWGQQTNQEQDLSLEQREDISLLDKKLPEKETSSLQSKFLFSSIGIINSLSQKVNTVLLKGNTVSWDVVAQKRYAVAVQSSTLDTVVRMILDNVTVYRDLYLGEQAGIVFSPIQNSTVEITAFANTIFLSNDDSIQDGSYTIKVYEIQAVPEAIDTVPYNTRSSIGVSDTIALRRAKEYKILIEQDLRVYMLLFSNDFDPLLELSDTYGRSTISDDWQGDESIITLVSPKTDNYFISISSFDGTQHGKYTLFVTTSKNEIILEDNNNISQLDKQLLSQYYKEYSITMKEREFRSLSLDAIDGDITVAFTTKEKQTIVQYDVKDTQSLSIPLFVHTQGEYLILLLSSTPVSINYTLKVYK